MDKEKFIEYSSLFFLDALDEAELKEFKEALESGNADFRKIFADFQKTALHLPLAAEQVDPPAHIKKSLLNSIRAKDVPEKHSTIDKLISFLGFGNPSFALGIAAILLIGIAALSYFVYQKESKINFQNDLIVQLRDEVQRNNEILKVLSAKKIDIVIMNGLEVNPSGYGKMLIDPKDKHAIMQVSNLPLTSKDKVYQLWVIKDNKPVSNGVFDIDKSKDNYFMVTNIEAQDVNKINAFAITLEPNGGVPQPTGKMYLLGQASL